MHLKKWAERRVLHCTFGSQEQWNVLNAMSNRYGSYMYAKEIKDGRSEVALSKEEQIVLEDCMNK